MYDDILSSGLLGSCGDVERRQHVDLISRYFRDRLMNLWPCKQCVEDNFFDIEKFSWTG